MAIKFTERSGIEILMDAVPRIISGRRPAGGVGLTDAPGGGGALSLAGPHLVYTGTLEDASKPRLLDRLKLVGLRYLVLQGDDPVATAQLTGEPSKPRLSHVNFGKLAEAMTRAVEVAEKLPEVRTSDFEPRFIEVPPLFLIALWLQSGKETIVIPLAPSPSSKLTANRPYSANEFAAIVRELALARKQQTREKKGLVKRDKMPS